MSQRTQCGVTQRDPSVLAQLGDAHLPEVSDGVGQRPLRGDIRWHPWVMLDLERERGCHTAWSQARAR